MILLWRRYSHLVRFHSQLVLDWRLSVFDLSLASYSSSSYLLIFLSISCNIPYAAPCFLVGPAHTWFLAVPCVLCTVCWIDCISSNFQYFLFLLCLKLFPLVNISIPTHFGSLKCLKKLRLQYLFWHQGALHSFWSRLYTFVICLNSRVLFLPTTL